MKKINEMDNFELLDLEFWCDKKIKLLGADRGAYYVALMEKAEAQREEMAINRCLEQFWAQKTIEGDK